MVVRVGPGSSSPPPARPKDAINVASSLRWLLGRGILLPSHGAYVGNAVFMVPVFMSFRDLPVGSGYPR